MAAADLHKKFQRMMRLVSLNPSAVDETADSDDNVSTVASKCGTYYVDEFVEEENRRVLETASRRSSIVPDYAESVSDPVSQGTVPNLQEIDAMELTKIYETFNFDHKAKTELKISYVKDRIVSMVEANQIVVIQGPTGCGKTTQVPQFILDSCFEKRKHCNIVVTQPRRIAAISIATRVSIERDWPLGSVVGYQVGMSRATSSETRLTYCTAGVLLQKLINTKHMLDYTHVILDEVHERDQDMDFLLLVVRRLLRTNSFAVRVILMSATFNVDKFARYFSVPVLKKLEPAPVIDVEKRSGFNVRIFYLCQLGCKVELSKDKPCISGETTSLCQNLIILFDRYEEAEAEAKGGQRKDSNRSAVLVFLPGMYEIEEMFNTLSVANNEIYKWDVVVLHSSITTDEQQRIFFMPPEGHRRVILCTNIAESSITVPDVKYVIDFCLTKQLVTDPRTNFRCLEMTWASRTNCIQRAGRTGRVSDGRVYRLVPQYFYENVLPEDMPPEMLRAPLESVVLKSKLLDMGSPKVILALALDPPDVSNLERTVLTLKEVGGLAAIEGIEGRYDGNLTELGRIMAQLPLDIRISKLIVLGQGFSVLRECVVIGASMSVKSMFSTPFRERIEARKAKLKWSGDSGSDCIAYLNVYSSWIHERVHGRIASIESEKAWARSHFVQIRVLREVDALVRDLTGRLSQLGICETTGPEKVLLTAKERAFVLKVVLAGAFYPYYFVKRFRVNEEFEEYGVKRIAGCDPKNTVYLNGWPMNQPARLYASQFQKIFRGCLDNPLGNVRASSDGSSRVYLQFRDNVRAEGDEWDTKISPSVYRAIVMRQYDVPVVIKLLDEETAKKRTQQLRLTVGKPSICPELPGIATPWVPLIITHIRNPGCFWAQRYDSELREKLSKIEKLVDQCRTIFEGGSSRDKIPIGALVVAPYEDDDGVTYCRATVTSYHLEGSDTVSRVFYIDYGNANSVRTIDLIPIDADCELRRIPGQAFKCALARLRPSILSNLTESWSSAALASFKDMLHGRVKLIGEIYSVVRSTVRIDLIRVDADQGENILVNEWLVENGFAERVEENYLSRCNYELRLRAEEMSPEQCRFYDEKQYEDDAKRGEYPTDLDKRSYSGEVKLRGPKSPLEMELVNLVAAGRNKTVFVHSESVNSVLLDEYPTDPHERMLVAGSVGQNQSGINLTLRNATLLPNIHGLPSLMALLFSPMMELRKNDRGDRFVGALCGLGFDPETNLSLFPEHDLYIAFDVELTTDDLEEINLMRYWINTVIRIGTPELCDNADMAACQKRIKRILFQMIQKKRESRDQETLGNSTTWTGYDLNEILVPAVETIRVNDIFKLHSALRLKDEIPGYEDMRAHLDDLRHIASGDTDRRKLFDIECKLCSTTMRDVAALRIHLSTAKHRGREKAANMSIC